ncbi:type II/IV secretion system ATPase subunit [Halospeciosus flavus]|uniref:type II/IV secretion system ATPase subunit n=1 Tax=Halospeciosus flavus TaxID=3032283 RepID=UPI00360EAAA6
MGGDTSGIDTDAVLDTVVDALREADKPFDAPDESAVRESFFDFEDVTAGEHIEHYWVTEPFALVSIRREEDGELRYHVAEPVLDDFEEHVREDLTEVLRRELVDVDVESADDPEAAFVDHLDDLLARHGAALDPHTQHKLAYYFQRDFVGYGVVDPLMSDPSVEDVSCDGANVPVFVYHADYGNVKTGLTLSEERLDSLVVRLAQRCDRHLSEAKPLLTDTLPDGSRAQVTLESDVATRGSNFTVRKFREEPFTPPELAAYGTFSIPQLAYIWLAVEHNKSVLFVGPTASGKTTSMNAVTLFVPPDDKVVSIEETREVNLPHENWIANVTREAGMGETREEVSTDDLLSEALHQRPDHVIVGEIRVDPDVVRTFFQAMGTGHAGFSTFHAETARDTLRRLRHDPLSVPDELLADLDVISVQHLLELDGDTARRCRWMTEVREAGASARNSTRCSPTTREPTVSNRPVPRASSPTSPATAGGARSS